MELFNTLFGPKSSLKRRFLTESHKCQKEWKKAQKHGSPIWRRMRRFWAVSACVSQDFKTLAPPQTFFWTKNKNFMTFLRSKSYKSSLWEGNGSKRKAESLDVYAGANWEGFETFQCVHGKILRHLEPLKHFLGPKIKILWRFWG